MEAAEAPPLERALLLHLLDHRGNQVRFEADQWTTEFGLFRAFSQVDIGEIKNALRSLEMARSIYRRVQYVIGYSEPKLVYSLTPSGHRKAIEFRRAEGGEPEAAAAAPGNADAPAESSLPEETQEPIGGPSERDAPEEPPMDPAAGVEPPADVEPAPGPVKASPAQRP